MRDSKSFVSNSKLKRGDTNDSVLELQYYLARYGYLTFDRTKRRVASRVVALKESLGTFGSSTEKAVRHWQSFLSLEVTGKIEAQDIAVINSPRCGCADIEDGVLTTPPLRRHFTNDRMKWLSRCPSFIRREDFEARMIRASKLWTDQTRFVHNIGNVFGNADWPTPQSFTEYNRLENEVLGRTVWRGNQPAHLIIFNDRYRNWYTGTGTPPANRIDFFSIALHEFGHWLGLGHSDHPDAVMFPRFSRVHRRIHREDIEAVIRRMYGLNGENETQLLEG